MPDQILTISEAATALRNGSTTSLKLTEMMLHRIHRLDETVGAFITVTQEAAMEAAKRADGLFAKGVDNGPLQGIPLSLKDILATEDAPTTGNSLVLDPDWGEGYDSFVASKLREAGAVLMGKNVLSEFATGKSDPEAFPNPLNPWNLSRSPGGSSSGTGIAIACGMVLGGLGTDTGGSIRHPSLMNGVTGLKPTFGLVSKWGCVPVSYSMDTIGPMARSALDCALILNAIKGFDERDPSSADVDIGNVTEGIAEGVKGVRVGVPTHYFYDHPLLDEEVKRAALGMVDVLRDLGAHVSEVELPHAELGHIAYNVTTAGDKAAYHAPDIGGEKWSDYGAQTRVRIGLGALYSAGDYVQAQRFRSWFSRQAAKLMDQVDVIVTPTKFQGSVPKSEERFSFAPNATAPFNLLGYPALALPAGFSNEGMPLSAQIVGAPFDDGMVLRVGHAIQQQTDWHLQVPPIASEAE